MLYQNYFLKKFIPIIFLSILFLSQFGYYVFYTIQLQLAKEAAKEQLLQQVPDSLLVKICLTGNEHTIQWQEEGKELSLNGEMYDVVKIKEENGKQYIFCVNDEKEDQVVEGFKKITASNTGNTPGKHHAITKIAIQQWIFESFARYSFPGISSFQTTSKYFDYTASLYNNYIDIISPPPNFITTKEQA